MSGVLVGREAGSHDELRVALYVALGNTLAGRRLRGHLDFDADGPPPPHAPTWGPCLPFTGGVSENGYGTFWWAPGQTRVAHKVAWEAVFGPVPAGRQLDHACHDWATCTAAEGAADPHRRCVSLAHLEVVSVGVNAARSRSVPGQNARRLWCSYAPEPHPLWHGHPNVYIHPTRGTRHCRACQVRRNSEWAARQRAAALAKGPRVPGRAPVARG